MILEPGEEKVPVHFEIEGVSHNAYKNGKNSNINFPKNDENVEMKIEVNDDSLLKVNSSDNINNIRNFINNSNDSFINNTSLNSMNSSSTNNTVMNTSSISSSSLSLGLNLSTNSNNNNNNNSNDNIIIENLNKVNPDPIVNNFDSNPLLPKKNQYFQNFKNKLLDYTPENPSFIDEYSDELYLNYLIEEDSQVYRPLFGYMNSQEYINPKLRSILIDWIIGVHNKMNFNYETLYQTVFIIDSFLSQSICNKETFQLLGTTAFFIACKSNEIYCPNAEEFVKMTDNAYTKSDLLQMEEAILKVLDFNILSPSGYNFFSIIAENFGFNEVQKTLGGYFLDAALLDYEMCKFPPSAMGAGVAYIVMKFTGMKYYKELYKNEIIALTSPQKIIKEVARHIVFSVKRMNNPKFDLNAVKEKYLLEKYHKVALLLDENQEN